MHHPEAARFRVRFGAYIFNDEGQILLLQNLKETWGIIGGHMDEGETPQQSLLREVKEETDLDVEIKELLSVSTQEDSVIITSVAKYTGGEIKISEEHLAYSWVNLDELDKFDLTFPQLPGLAKKALAKLS